jgi:hypothetical protein
MKAAVAVTVQITTKVYLDVEYEGDDDPCSLTDEERERAISDARDRFGSRGFAEVIDVEVCR